jgi:uncharacterized protein YfdQ (DUF2303 family)
MTAVQEIKVIDVVSPRGKEGVIVPEGYHLIKSPDFTSYNKTLVFKKLEEFTSYVGEYKRGETRILPGADSFTCDFQYHSGDEPNKNANDHLAILNLQTDPDFARWKDNAGKWMEQRPFSDFMADYAKDFHAIERTEILSIAKKIKVVDQSTLNTEYENGGLDVMFNSTERATFGDKPMPESFEIALPVYHGFKAYIMPLRIFWVKDNGKVKLKYEFIRLHLVTDKAFSDAATLVAKQTEVKVFGY